MYRTFGRGLMDSHTGWMIHSYGMAQARLDKLRDDADAGLRAALESEVHLRQYVITHLSVSDALTGRARVWYVYMACHAHLQMRLYGRTISQDTFSSTCKRLRAERDQALQRVAGMPWLDSNLIDDDAA